MRLIGETTFIFGRPEDPSGTGEGCGAIVVLGGYGEPSPSYVLSCTCSFTFLDCFYRRSRR
jgi:hypothetical protein